MSQAVKLICFQKQGTILHPQNQTCSPAKSLTVTVCRIQCFSTFPWLQDFIQCQMCHSPPFLPTAWYFFPLCLLPCKASPKYNFSTGMLEQEGIVFIQLKLSPVALWEPTHFIPKYSCLASRLDLYIALEGGTDASSSKRAKLLQARAKGSWCGNGAS